MHLRQNPKRKPPRQTWMRASSHFQAQRIPVRGRTTKTTTRRKHRLTDKSAQGAVWLTRECGASARRTLSRTVVGTEREY